MEKHNVYDYENNDIKISVIFPNKSARLLANANVSISTVFGFLTIKGFQVWVSSRFNERLGEAINITPPSRIFYGHPVHLCFFEDEQQWVEIERLLYSAYRNALDKRKEKEADNTNSNNIGTIT